MSSNSADKTPSTRMQVVLAIVRGIATGITRAVAGWILGER